MLPLLKHCMETLQWYIRLICIPFFFQISLEHEILLHPRYFGPNLLNTVKQKLFTEVEGTCTGKWVQDSFKYYRRIECSLSVHPLSVDVAEYSTMKLCELVPWCLCKTQQGSSFTRMGGMCTFCTKQYIVCFMFLSRCPLTFYLFINLLKKKKKKSKIFLSHS